MSLLLLIRHSPSSFDCCKCVPCAAGTYQDQSSHTSATCKTATACTAGFYAPAPQSLSSDRDCQACPVRYILHDVVALQLHAFYFSHARVRCHINHPSAGQHLPVVALLHRHSVHSVVDLRCGQIRQQNWQQHDRPRLLKLRQRYEEKRRIFLFTTFTRCSHIGHVFYLQESTRPRPTRARAQHGHPALLANTSAMAVQPAAIDSA